MSVALAEADWVASHDAIVRRTAKRRAGSRRDRIEDYEQVGRLALVEVYRRWSGDSADAEAYARAAVERRTARLWITFEAVRPPKRGGRPIAVESVEGIEIEDREERRMGDIKETVEHALEELTDEEKVMVRWRFINGDSVDDIAWVTNTSESSVRRTLRSALGKMRAAMDREDAAEALAGLDNQAVGNPMAEPGAVVASVPVPVKTGGGAE